LKGKERHSNVLNFRSFRIEDCDTDHYLVVAKFMELLVNKGRSHRFHMEWFNLTKLNEAGGKERYRIEVFDRFAALEDLDKEVDINSAWETIREDINISAKELLSYFKLKKHEGCSEFVDQRKQDKPADISPERQN
jgi:hypothetical protein